MAFQWGFHYSGPRAPTSDMSCVTCRAGATGKCDAHGQNYVLHCAHCQSAQGAPCQSHWGLAAAIVDFEKRLDGAGAADFKLTRAIIEQTPPHPTFANVTVTARSNGDLADMNEREFVLAIKAWP